MSDIQGTKKNFVVAASVEEVPRDEQAVYIVEEGEVNMSLFSCEPYTDNVPVKIGKGRLKRGDYFGLQSLTNPEQGKRADIAPGSHGCRLLRLAVEGYELFPEVVKERLVQQVASCGVEERMPVLRKMAIFEEISEIYLWALCELFVEMKYSDGEVVMRQGEDIKGWYVIAKGQVCASVSEVSMINELNEMDVAQEEIGCSEPDTTNDTEQVQVALYESGDSFGELELEGQCPCQVTVGAVGNVLAYHIPESVWGSVPNCVKDCLHPRIEQHEQMMIDTQERVLHERAHQDREMDEALQMLATVIHKQGGDEQTMKYVMVHANTCGTACVLGVHCESAKKKIELLKEHHASCMAIDKNLCQKCNQLEELTMMTFQPRDVRKLMNTATTSGIPHSVS